jgi:hypothetical protein
MSQTLRKAAGAERISRRPRPVVSGYECVRLLKTAAAAEMDDDPQTSVRIAFREDRAGILIEGG